ncbi:MAG: hypothetical protein P8M25_03500, partial [Paracoccaceae bacterium]|nr:hypothetical protein [Paracoccaceae bacterium]
AVADLSGNSGWKAQIEAAERLVKSGALSENQLLGIYTARLPAASGGVWDRVAGLQRFDQALTGGSPNAINAALSDIWPQMQGVGLAVGFARMFGRALIAQPFSQTTDRLSFDVPMLGQTYHAAAQARPLRNREDRFLAALARGQLGNETAFNPESEAILRGFESATVPPALQTLLDQDRLGEVILRAIESYTTGAEGDLQQLSAALATFQAVKLHSTARSASLQLLLLR